MNDIFGERIHGSEALQQEARVQLAQVSQAPFAVPPAFRSAYVPSGRSEASSFPKLLVGGLLGGLVGALIAAVVVAIAGAVFFAFGAAGVILVVVFIIAWPVFYFGPALIPIG